MVLASEPDQIGQFCLVEGAFFDLVFLVYKSKKRWWLLGSDLASRQITLS